MSKLPTIRDIAREAGVSVSAVSHAFNRPEEISTDLRERILRVAQERGYHPDPRARGLRRGESSLIALVITNLANLYYSVIAQTVQQVIASQGYHLVILSSDGTREGELRCLKAIRNERMAGAIVDLHHLNSAETLASKGETPTVFITDQHETLNVPAVRIDNFTAAYAAAIYLARIGKQRIAHITGPLDSRSGAQRRAAYRQAIQDMGLGEPLEVIGDYLFPTGRRAMDVLLNTGQAPDAVFAGNDLMALGALSLLRDRGLAVPEDIAVIGFDNIEEATWSVPPLTTIDQPATEIAAAAARLLLQALKEPTSTATINITCTLVPRASA